MKCSFAARNKTSDLFAQASNKGTVVNDNDQYCSDNINSDYRTISMPNLGKRKISGYLLLLLLLLFSTTHCSLKAYCAIWVRRSNFRHQASHACHHARAPSGRSWNCGREMSGNFT